MVLSNNLPSKGFHLDKQNGKIMGVCSGLARWSGIDVTIWRVGFALATIFGFGSPIIIYVLIGLLAK